jgi:hypothetical protein
VTAGAAVVALLLALGVAGADLDAVEDTVAARVEGAGAALGVLDAGGVLGIAALGDVVGEAGGAGAAAAQLALVAGLDGALVRRPLEGVEEHRGVEDAVASVADAEEELELLAGDDGGVGLEPARRAVALEAGAHELVGAEGAGELLAAVVTGGAHLEEAGVDAQVVAVLVEGDVAGLLVGALDEVSILVAQDGDEDVVELIADVLGVLVRVELELERDRLRVRRSAEAHPEGDAVAEGARLHVGGARGRVHREARRVRGPVVLVEAAGRLVARLAWRTRRPGRQHQHVVAELVVDVGAVGRHDTAAQRRGGGGRERTTVHHHVLGLEDAPLGGVLRGRLADVDRVGALDRVGLGEGEARVTGGLLLLYRGARAVLVDLLVRRQRRAGDRVVVVDVEGAGVRRRIAVVAVRRELEAVLVLVVAGLRVAGRAAAGTRVTRAAAATAGREGAEPTRATRTSAAAAGAGAAAAGAGAAATGAGAAAAGAGAAAAGAGIAAAGASVAAAGAGIAAAGASVAATGASVAATGASVAAARARVAAAGARIAAAGAGVAAARAGVAAAGAGVAATGAGVAATGAGIAAAGAGVAAAGAGVAATGASVAATGARIAATGAGVAAAGASIAAAGPAYLRAARAGGATGCLAGGASRATGCLASGASGATGCLASGAAGATNRPGCTPGPRNDGVRGGGGITACDKERKGGGSENLQESNGCLHVCATLR